MLFVVWISSIASVFVDNVFREYFTITPLYFLLESLYQEEDKWKALRLIIFSLLYQSFAYHQLNFLWLFIVFFVIMVELYRDSFYYPWSASLLQAVVFLLPYYYNRPLTLIYGFLIDFLLFVYIYKSLFANSK
ncbi:hypothetical protein [Fervidobacterium sp. 2310opik-2]|uniref:hypothetical protein n=1 Tax=Fervidobacterium sp. 2310opik-2 TaxID=1755815 RepID=UPI0013DFCCAD|nr:hypothetical protein [Fervidobacterium sp. 2310opik-2]KAF2962462.1 hypothetical protein AS161_00105 [Fervidobacterium sp. 2310opik-2]